MTNSGPPNCKICDPPRPHWRNEPHQFASAPKRTKAETAKAALAGVEARQKAKHSTGRPGKRK